jgi:Carboxypeptidase regulatory-like domain
MKQGVRYFKSLRVLSLVFSLMTLCAGMAFGQAISGNLVGTVTDPTSAVVANAEVTATNVGTSASAVTHSNSTGEYRFDNLPVGTYRITVKAAGFRTFAEQADVVLNKTGTRNASMIPGAASETVEVSGAAPAIDTTTAQLESTFDPQYSQDLGLTSAGGAGAGVLNLSLLTPGVTNGSSMGDGVGPSVGGQRPRDNNFTVEGVDNNNKTVTGALITVPPEAVENFTLLSNQFNAEFGHSSGGQFNTTVKTGTNSFHGSVYEYFRNRNLNAVDQTWVQQGLTTNPRFDSNRFGGTLGGPIIKNKLFFFTNFERNPVGFISVGGGAVQTPTVAGLAAMNADPNLNATNFGIFQTYVPLATTPSGCMTYNGTTNSGATKIGTTPYSAPANGTCGAGTVEVGNVQITPAAWQSWTNFVQSVDYNISDKDQIRGRFIYNKENLLDNAAQLGTFFAPYSITFALVNASEYHTFSPSVTNEFRVGYNRFDENIPAGNFQYPGLDVFPNVTLLDLGNGLNVGPDGNAPQFTIQNFYQVVDNVSLVKGKHTIKIGGEYRWYISPQGFTQRARGDYEYNATQVFLEDFAPDNFGQRSTGSSTYYGNQKAIYWYVNDTWRVSQHLSLNAGVRYEYTTTPIGENRQTLNAISDTPSILVPQAGNQPLVFGKIQPSKNNWAPRIGFAYSPGSSGSTSIRGGFGMAYDTLYDNIGSLAVPPQIGSTENVAAGLPAPNVAPLTPNFLANGGLPPGGGSGITVLSKADALANTANWLPNKEQDPYSINWNFGVQHAFGKNYSAEINYVGTRGIHLPMQNIFNLASVVTPATALPTYTTAPDQATLDALPNSLNNLLALQAANIEPANFVNAGFFSAITTFVPRGESSYNGLQAGLTRRFSNGLTFQSAYTWSHTIDNSTADFHTSDITPRRPQDFFNLAPERSNSALDRAQRFTVAIVYDLPFFKGGNWMMKNILGNWTFSPVYTFETGQWVTVQSQQDANLNGDPAGDRVITNPAGVRGTGTDVSPLTALSGPNAGSVVAYVANNPSAQFIRAGLGALPNTGRNTLQTPGTNNIDLGIYKDLHITETMKFRFGAQFGNIINHPQFIPGSNPGFGLGVNDVNGFSSVGTGYTAFVTPGDANFNNPRAVFASNARTIALMAKFSF